MGIQVIDLNATPAPPQPDPQIIELGEGKTIKIPAATAPGAPPPPSAPWYSGWHPWYGYYPVAPPPPPPGPVVIVNKRPPPPPTPPPPPPKIVTKVVVETVEVTTITTPLPKFSKFSIVSIVFFALGILFSIACIIGTYNVEESWIDALGLEDILEEDNNYLSTRHMAIGCGAASTLCFTVATLCSFYAGMKYAMKWNSNQKKEKQNCCMSGFVIAAWVIFSMTFILNLILLVMAFDTMTRVYPDAVWVAFLGSLFAWLLMFGYSEMTRRASVSTITKKNVVKKEEKKEDKKEDKK